MSIGDQPPAVRGEWFRVYADAMSARMRRETSALEVWVGIRLNAEPHVGTYLVLASSFGLASRAAGHFGLPARVRIQFLDNDPAPLAEVHQETHFHSIRQAKAAGETTSLVEVNYLPFLRELSGMTGCSVEAETYSQTQSQPEFRAAVLDTLQSWDVIRDHVLGIFWPGIPSGVRGLGFPCPECGLFNGGSPPSVQLASSSAAILTTDCCHHGEYSIPLTCRTAFLNLETIYRNVVKERLATAKRDVLSVMVKGFDWEPFLPKVDHIHGLLATDDRIPPRFLFPVVAAEDGRKLSKSAILASPQAFPSLPPALLDMGMLRAEFDDSTARLLDLSIRLLEGRTFGLREVMPSDILRMMEIRA
ncbi:MAG TPA: hypothetical protein VLD63_09540 [Anaerolineales bacterium]|nr:hypothetical protein [Anaerolineales bacterium]